MISRVKHLVSELARFNPEARLTQELRISGSPACECDVSCEAFDFGIRSIIDQNNELHGEVEELECRIGDLESALKDIQDVLRKRMPEEAIIALDEINKLVEDVL